METNYLHGLFSSDPLCIRGCPRYEAASPSVSLALTAQAFCIFAVILLVCPGQVLLTCSDTRWQSWGIICLIERRLCPYGHFRLNNCHPRSGTDCHRSVPYWKIFSLFFAIKVASANCARAQETSTDFRVTVSENYIQFLQKIPGMNSNQSINLFNIKKVLFFSFVRFSSFLCSIWTFGDYPGWNTSSKYYFTLNLLWHWQSRQIKGSHGRTSLTILPMTLTVSKPYNLHTFTKIPINDILWILNLTLNSTYFKLNQAHYIYLILMARHLILFFTKTKFQFEFLQIH